MRVALAAEGTRGDVHPMLALGAALRAEGHEAVLCAPPDFAEAARLRGLEFRAVGASIREYLTREAGILLASPLRLMREVERHGRRMLEAQMAALPEATRGADLVFAAGVEFGAASAAELHGVPYRYVAYCPAILPSAEHAPAMLPLPTLPRWLNRGTWRLLQAGWNRRLRPALDAERARLGLPPVGDLLAHLAGERPILAADRELAPLPADVPFPVEQAPCLHPFEETGALPEKLESFLAEGPPPIYVGFGSMTDPDPATTTRRLLEAIASLGCRALVSRGWAGLAEGPLPAGVLAIDAVPHARLFPRVAAVVHHGGAGTTTTAARAGVPQVIVPHVLDQFYWARRVARLGLGPPALPRRRLRAEALARTLAEVIDNEILAERAREIGARLRAGLAAAAPPAALSGSART